MYIINQVTKVYCAQNVHALPEVLHQSISGHSCFIPYYDVAYASNTNKTFLFYHTSENSLLLLLHVYIVF